jgi:hypothetical protein
VGLTGEDEVAVEVETEAMGLAVVQGAWVALQGERVVREAVREAKVGTVGVVGAAADWPVAALAESVAILQGGPRMSVPP